MEDTRSPSQILFSHLPAQTSDIKSRIWKVQEWVNPIALNVEPGAIKRRLLGALEPWEAQHHDDGISNQLRQGRAVEVVGVNPQQGVKVDLFPNAWRCTKCRRVGYQRGECVCGNKVWAQLHFVAFHECGYLGDPMLPKCPTHGQAKVHASKSSSVYDLQFSCPVCLKKLSQGLGLGRPCPGCGQKPLQVNVHRAATVFTPWTFTMVNPARPEHLQDLLADGGPEKSLRWVLADLPAPRPQKLAATRQSMISDFVAKGIPAEAAEAAVDTAIAKGAVIGDGATDMHLPAQVKEDAENSAVEVALAMYEGHRSATSMPGEPVGAELETIYREKYPPAIHRAGLADVDLVDRFPILRGVFGFTRGGRPAGDSRIVTYTGKKGDIRLYGDANETEAFYLRLDPVRVATWLVRKRLLAQAPIDPEEARLEILRHADIPGRGADITQETVGSAVLTLLHSYSHRFIRQLAVLAGVDRESLAEYLVPQHLGVFVYATPRGEFVLGGLQAVFETDLDRVLDLQVDAENRCPLDPACDRATGACLACLHIGEPSCSHYNRFLSRRTLFGRDGYLREDLS